MQSHRNYHLRIDPQLSMEEIRSLVEDLDDGTYFLRIDPDPVAGPFAELHGDPTNSEKIAEKLQQLARSKVKHAAGSS